VSFLEHVLPLNLQHPVVAVSQIHDAHGGLSKMRLLVPEGRQIQLWKMGVMMKDRVEVLRRSATATGSTWQKLKYIFRRCLTRESGNACLRTEQAASPFFLEDNHRNDLHEHALVDIPGSNLKYFALNSVAIQFTRNSNPPMPSQKLCIFFPARTMVSGSFPHNCATTGLSIPLQAP